MVFMPKSKGTGIPYGQFLISSKTLRPRIWLAFQTASYTDPPPQMDGMIVLIFHRPRNLFLLCLPRSMVKNELENKFLKFQNYGRIPLKFR